MKENEDPDEPTAENDPLASMLMCLCMLVLMQDTSRIPLYESPLMHYMAVRGIDVQGPRLRSSMKSTPTMGRILWIGRLIMLEVAVPLVGWPELRLEARHELRSVPERIQEIRRRHLCEGSFSPISSILSQLAKGKKSNDQHQEPSNINWSRDEETVYYLGPGIRMDRLRWMCRNLIYELNILIRELMFDQPPPAIDLTTIEDTMAWSAAFRRLEYSFIENIKNHQKCKVGWEYLYRHIRRKDSPWSLIKKTSDGTETWNQSQKRAYLKKGRQFLYKLMETMHITGGQPARGPEIGSIKVSNSVYSARNIYVINGQVCFLTMYDKSRKRRGNTDYIVRFLPTAVSQIVVQYLVYIRPFA
ncbi:hypothetical protein F5884DRAFT_742883, partial [Xylogone sp. PMI_703]